jgi:hypothetical protein
MHPSSAFSQSEFIKNLETAQQLSYLKLKQELIEKFPDLSPSEYQKAIKFICELLGY